MSILREEGFSEVGFNVEVSLTGSMENINRLREAIGRMCLNELLYPQYKGNLVLLFPGIVECEPYEQLMEALAPMSPNFVSCESISVVCIKVHTTSKHTAGLEFWLATAKCLNLRVSGFFTNGVEAAFRVYD